MHMWWRKMRWRACTQEHNRIGDPEFMVVDHLVMRWLSGKWVTFSESQSIFTDSFPFGVPFSYFSLSPFRFVSIITLYEKRKFNPNSSLTLRCLIRISVVVFLVSRLRIIVAEKKQPKISFIFFLIEANISFLLAYLFLFYF